MAFRSRLSGIPTIPLCYMNVAGTACDALPRSARKPSDIAVYAVSGSKWADVATTGLKAAENLWVYEVVLRGGVDTRFVLADAVSARRIFRTVTITFHSRTIINDDHRRHVVVEAGTDTFTDVVFFEKDRPKPGLPFERFFFTGTAGRNHKPRIQTVAR